MRWMPAPRSVSRWTSSTTRTFSAARSGRGSRPPRWVETSRSVPLSVAETTSPTQSTKVVAPGEAQLKVIVEDERHVVPSSIPVRSTSRS